tara:strand:- start:1094 stop:1675 length:582 start_codon:yes stop_codon:yes gene_type:complete
MPITSLKFRPGINKETTSYSNKGGWNDCDLVRFRFGYPEKLGGWEKYSSSTFLGTARTLHAWANLQGNNYLGVGTEKKFYIEESQSYNDITPLRRKVVSGEVVFDLDGQTVVASVSGNAGTTGLGTPPLINAQSNDTLAPTLVTGVSGTGEVGTATVALTNPVPSATAEVGDLTIETTVVPTSITVTDFLDES